jgi:hypothetical protein
MRGGQEQVLDCPVWLINRGEVKYIRLSCVSFVVGLPFNPLFLVLQKSQQPSLTPESTRKLLLCFLWVIKNEESGVLKEWWARQPSSM